MLLSMCKFSADMNVCCTLCSSLSRNRDLENLPTAQVAHAEVWVVTTQLLVVVHPHFRHATLEFVCVLQ